MANSISSFTLKKNISSVVCAMAFTGTLFVGVGAGAWAPMCNIENLPKAEEIVKRACRKYDDETATNDTINLAIKIMENEAKNTGKDSNELCMAAQDKYQASAEKAAAAKKDDDKAAKEDAKILKKDVKDIQKELMDAQNELQQKLQEAKAKYDEERLKMSNVDHPKQIEEARNAKMGIEGALRKLQNQKAEVDGNLVMAKTAASLTQSQLASAGSSCNVAAEANKIDLEKKFKGIDKGALLEQDRQYRAQCIKNATDEANAKITAANIKVTQAQAHVTQIAAEIAAYQTQLTEADAKLQGLPAKQAAELAALSQAYNEKVAMTQNTLMNNINRLNMNLNEARTSQHKQQMMPYLVAMQNGVMGDSSKASGDANSLSNYKKQCGCNKQPYTPDNEEICKQTESAQGTSAQDKFIGDTFNAMMNNYAQ